MCVYMCIWHEVTSISSRPRATQQALRYLCLVHFLCDLMAQILMDYGSLSDWLQRTPFPLLVQQLRTWGLLRSASYCPAAGCNAVTPLRVPGSENEEEESQYTECVNPDCRQNDGHRTVIYYKNGSIFEKFRMLSVAVLVRVIALYSFVFPPSDVVTVVGSEHVGVHSVRDVYDFLRQCTAFIVTQQQTHTPLGGLDPTESPLSVWAVNTDLAGFFGGRPMVATSPVEVDEGTQTHPACGHAHTHK